jgi:hypothetical protein
VDDKLLWEVETAICTVLRVSGPAINPNTALIAGLGATSLDFAHLADRLQKIVDAEVDLLRLLQRKRLQGSDEPVEMTVQEVVDYLKAQIAKRRLRVEQAALHGPAPYHQFENYPIVLEQCSGT